MISFKQFLAESEVLHKYTSTDEFRFYKGRLADDFKQLRDDYPYAGGKLYRGLNFSSPKQYLQFRRAIRNGYVSSDSITSWSPDIATAQQFAKSPQVFNPSSSALFGYDPNERVSGFIGAVLVTQVGPNVGIDVNKSNYASESEVILPAGKYKVVDLIIEKKWKHIVHKLDINQEVIDIINSGRKVDNELMRQLFRYKGGDLYDDVKKQIVDHAVTTFINTNVVSIKLDSVNDFTMSIRGYKSEHQLLFPDGEYKFNVYGSLGMLDFFYSEDIFKYLTPAHRKAIRTNIVAKIDRATKVIDKKSVFIQYSPGFAHLLSIFDLTLNDFKYLSRAYADTYTRFNALLRDWNKNHHFDVSRMTSLLKDSMKSPL